MSAPAASPLATLTHHTPAQKAVSQSSLLFYAAVLGFFFGIAAASSAAVSLGTALVCGVPALACAALYAFSRERVYLVVAVFGVCAALGLARYALLDIGTPYALASFEGQHATLAGTICAEPDRREKNTHLTLCVTQANEKAADGTVLIFADRLSKIAYGDRVHVEGTLTPPAPFETEFGRTFNYPKYLEAQGITETMSFAHIEKVGDGAGNALIAYLISFKRTVSDSIDRALMPPESGLALGLLLGEKQALGTELLRSFRNAGLIHIVVLSGYNISILIEALLWSLAFLSIRPRALIALASIALFVLMVGPSATVLRAALMAALGLFARVTGRTYDIMRALLLSAVVIVLWNPLLFAYDPGFALSFLATLGLVLILPILETYAERIPSRFGAKEIALTTIATQLMVLPYLAYTMGSVSLVALIPNMLVLPAIPLAMLLSGFVGALGTFAPQLALLCGYLAQLVLTYVITLATFFGNLPFATVTLPVFPIVVPVALYSGYALFFWYRSLPKRPPQAVKPVADVFPF
jgi:competence protein ComEC